MPKFKNPQTGQVDDVPDALAYHYVSHGWVEVGEQVERIEEEPPQDIAELLSDLDASPKRKGKHAAE